MLLPHPTVISSRLFGEHMVVQASSDSTAVVVSRGASYLTIQAVVTSAAQVLSFAILARIITPTEVGILAILTLVTALSQSINGAAFQQAAMKYVGEYADANRDLAAGVFFQTLRVSLVISIPFAVFIFLGSGLLAKMLLGTVSQAGLFQILSVDLLMNAGALQVATGTVLGAKCFKVAATIGAAGAILRQILIILLILFLKNFVGLVYGWVLSDLAMFAGFGLYAVRTLGLTTKLFELRKLMSFSWPLSVGNIISFAYGWFDRAILIVFVPLASLGVYTAALYALGVIGSVSVAFTNTLLPVYSSISAGRGLEGSRQATRLGSRYVSLVMVPLAFGLFATAKPALTLFVGNTYAAGALPLMILSLASALTTLSAVLSPMLTALAKTRAIMCITIGSVALGVCSAYALLPFMGIVGASVARDVAMVVSLCLTIYVLKRAQALSIDFDMAWKSTLAGAVMGAVLVAAQTVVYSKILLPAYVVLGAIIYLVLLRVLRAVGTRDIQLIQEYLGARLGFLAAVLGAIVVPRGSGKTLLSYPDS